MTGELKKKPLSLSTTELVHENTVLRHVCEISQLFATGNDTQSVLISILDKMRESLSADTACILTWPEDVKDWVIRTVSSDMDKPETFTVSHTIVHEATHRGMATLFADALADVRLDPSESIISQGISSALCAPLKLGDRCNGILLLDRRNRKEAFTPIDLRFTATVANVINVFLEKEKSDIEARKNARLAVIGEVIAGLAHYAKNIVMGFKLSISSLQTLLKKGQFDSLDECLGSISTQERRISNLILDMLSYAKDRTPSRSRLLLKTAIRSVVGPYTQHLEESGIQFELDCPDNAYVHADESALHRVFLNLFVNALDAFKTKVDGDRKIISVSVDSTPENQVVDIRFRDTGCGIPPDTLGNIFKVFYTTKGSGGTGLGLAVVQKIIEEHGGDISVTSQEDEGTEFRITLPVSRS